MTAGGRRERYQSDGGRSDLRMARKRSHVKPPAKKAAILNHKYP